MKTLCALGLLFCVVFPSIALAHEFEKSGTLEALMYVEPHETVNTGEPVTIHVVFQTAPADFDLTNADLKVTLFDGEIPLAEKSLTDLDVTKTKNAFYFPFTFLHDGMYTLTVEGSVGSWVVTYHFNSIHVGMGEELWDHLRYHFAHILIFGIGIIAGFILAFWKPKKRTV